MLTESVIIIVIGGAFAVGAHIIAKRLFITPYDNSKKKPVVQLAVATTWYFTIVQAAWLVAVASAAYAILRTYKPETPAALTYVVIAIAFIGVAYPFIAASQIVRRWLQDWKEGLEQAHQDRQELRERTRRFAEFLEDQYSWVLQMGRIERQRRALQWFDEIKAENDWKQENQTFQELRSSDQAEDVLEDLGDQGSRMMQIWERRREVYQYAIAFSTEGARAEEMARLEDELDGIRERRNQNKRQQA